MMDEVQNFMQGWVIVLVDDEADSLEVAEILLMQYGAEVHTASNGVEGLTLIRKVRPKFVVTDLSMPGMDGWSLIEAMQHDRSMHEIPIVALTAHAMAGDRDRAIAAGFHNYLTKPLTPKSFYTDLMGVLTDMPLLAADLPDTSPYIEEKIG